MENKNNPATVTDDRCKCLGLLINTRHCKVCGKCVEVCPNDVLEISRINPAEFKRLGWFTRMKVRRHEMLVVSAIRPCECRMCGCCVEVCPKDAISIVSLSRYLLPTV